MKAFLKEKVYASVARVRMNNRDMEISSGVRVEPALQTVTMPDGPDSHADPTNDVVCI